MAFVKPDKVGAQIPSRQIGQGIEVAHREFGEGVRRIDRLFMHLIAAAHVVLQLEAILGVDRVALLVHPLGIKGGADKELGEAIQPRFEEAVVDLEEEVGEFGAGPGVVAAAMTAHKLLVFTRLGVSGGAEKQHVFQKMGHPLAVGRIVKMTGIDRQRGGRFVGIGITNQQDPEPVGQLQKMVLPMVIGTGIWAHWRVTHVGFI